MHGGLRVFRIKSKVVCNSSLMLKLPRQLIELFLL